MRMTQHSKARIVERDNGVNSVAEAKRVAKQAFTAGKTLNHFQRCPTFYYYLQRKRNQTHDCSVRVYRDNIYIWKGKKKSLITMFPIPDRFHKELEALDQ